MWVQRTDQAGNRGTFFQSYASIRSQSGMDGLGRKLECFASQPSLRLFFFTSQLERRRTMYWKPIDRNIYIFSPAYSLLFFYFPLIFQTFFVVRDGWTANRTPNQYIFLLSSTASQSMRDFPKENSQRKGYLKWKSMPLKYVKLPGCGNEFILLRCGIKGRYIGIKVQISVQCF